MNQEQLQGNWQQIKGKFQEKWGKLTDDDLKESQGNMKILIGKMTERYGITKEKASEKLDKYLNRFDSTGNESTSIVTRVSDITETINDKVYSAAKCCQKFAKDKPITTLGIVAAAGALIGMLISRSRSKSE